MPATSFECAVCGRRYPSRSETSTHVSAAHGLTAGAIDRAIREVAIAATEQPEVIAPSPLIPCLDCGTEISRHAVACPKCGRPATVSRDTQSAAHRSFPLALGGVTTETEKGLQTVALLIGTVTSGLIYYFGEPVWRYFWRDGMPVWVMALGWLTSCGSASQALLKNKALRRQAGFEAPAPASSIESFLRADVPWIGLVVLVLGMLLLVGVIFLVE